ncbi:MAG: hypothetical protein ACP5JP_09265 [bacterium]
MDLKSLICKIKLYLYKKELSAYIDNSLEKTSEKRILHLISTCPEAKTYLEKLLALERKIKSIPLSEPSVLVKERIDNAIINIGREQRIKKITPKYFPKWVYALSAISIILLSVIAVSFFTRKPQNNNVNTQLMLASMDMYQHIDLYENMDMIEHLNEIMVIEQTNQDVYRELK